MLWKTGYKAEETVIIGDRVYTDIACGVNAGVSTIFVLKGEGALEDAEANEEKHEYIYKSVAQLYKELTGR